jgi:hypothetical protein
VRYKNHYFLPHLHNFSTVYIQNRVSSRIDFRYQSFPIFWALYALKLAGIAPARKIPLVMEFDHPVEPFSYPRDYVMAGQSDTIPYYEQVRRELLLTQWLLDFAKPRGLQFVWGGRNGRRYGQGSDRNWWVMLYGGGTADSPYESGFGNIGRGYAQEHLKILQANPDVFAMGIHDHTSPPNPGGGFNNGRYATITIYRHADPGYRFAAPNPIPTQTGNRVINRRVLPKDWTPGENDFLFPRGRETFVDVNNTSVTTASNYTGRDGTYWAASVFLERDRAEMAALGLPHHGGDNVRYTNHARDSHGGEGYWDAWVEQGFRGFRAMLAEPPLGNVYPSGNPYRLRYRNIQFVPSIVTDFTPPAAGFYHNSVPYSDTAFGVWKLENGTELRGANNEWMNNANWRREKGIIAIRRWLSMVVDVSLYSACCWQGTFYVHPCAAVAWVEAIEQALADASPFEGDSGQPILERAVHLGEGASAGVGCSRAGAIRLPQMGHHNRTDGLARNGEHITRRGARLCALLLCALARLLRLQNRRHGFENKLDLGNSEFRKCAGMDASRKGKRVNTRPIRLTRYSFFSSLTTNPDSARIS